LTLFLIGCKGFLRKHIATHLESLDDEFMMRCVDGGYNEQVRLRFPHHLFKVEERRTLRPDVLFGKFQTPFIDVTEAHELQNIAVLFLQPPSPETHPANTGSYQCNAQFSFCRETKSPRGHHVAGSAKHTDGCEKFPS